MRVVRRPLPDRADASGGAVPTRAPRAVALERWRAELIESAGGALDRQRLDSPRRWPGPRVDLTPSDTVDPAAVRMLLAGRTVRLSQLVVPAAFPAVARRVRAIDRAARAAHERHGLDLLRIVLGTVTWNEEQAGVRAGPDPAGPDPAGPDPASTVDPHIDVDGDPDGAVDGPVDGDAGPVGGDVAIGVDLIHGRADPVLPALVATVQLSRRPADDADLTVRGRWELPPAVLSRLADAGVPVDPGAILGSEGGGRLALDRLQRLGATVPGFRVNQRVLLGILPFLGRTGLDDLDELDGLDHRGDPGGPAVVGPIVAALGGDEAAADEVRRAGRGVERGVGVERGGGGVDRLGDLAILGADADQRAVVDAVEQGGHVAVAASPGTGVARTIVHVAAALAAQGRTVLVVADETATRRRIADLLAAAGLSDLLVDLDGIGAPETSAAGRALAERVLAGAGGWSMVGRPGPDPDEARRDELVTLLARYDRALTEVRDPWGLAAHEVIAELLALERAAASDEADTQPVGLPRRVVAGVGARDLDIIGREIAEWVALGGVEMARGEGVWAGSLGLVTSEAHARDVAELVRRIGAEQLPAVRRELDRIVEQLGLPGPASLASADELIGLLEEAGELAARYRAEVFSPTVDLGGPTEVDGAHGWRARRTERRAGRAARTALEPFRIGGSDRSRAAALADRRAILRVRARWAVVAPEGRAMPPEFPMVGTARAALAALGESLGRLAGYAPEDRALRPTAGLDELADRLAVLAAAHDQLAALARLDHVRHHLAARELMPVLDAVVQRGLGAAGAVMLFRRSWFRAVLDEIELIDDAIGAADADLLDEAADELARLETRRRARVPVLVRAEIAGRAAAAVESHPEALERVRRATSTDEPVSATGVFTDAHPLLAALPVWLASPHTVASVAPLGVPLGPGSGPSTPFDVVVVVGAEHLTVADAVPALARARQIAVVGDPRRTSVPPTSLLDAVRGLLPSHRRLRLRWFHRRGDGRLAHLAESVAGGDPMGLLAIPTPQTEAPVRRVRLPTEPAASESARSVEEISAVVDLVVEHAVRHPDWSLAVVATNEEQADRLAAQLRSARAEDRVLERLFAGHDDEPVIVRSSAGLAGELRDHVIVVVAAAAGPDHPPVRLVEPIEPDATVLGVIAAARHRLTIVTADDAVPDAAAPVVARLIELAASDGPPVGRVGRPDPVLADVADELRRRGVPVEVVPGRVPELTLQHPADPGRPVLGVLGDRPLHAALVPVVERECLVPEHLSRLGWRWHRVRSVEWLRSKEVELDRLLDSWQRAR